MEFEKVSDVVILEDYNQLRLLAKVLLRREVPLMSNLNSEKERVEYLTTVHEAHEKLINLLAEAEQLRKTYQQEGAQVKAVIAKHIEKYVIYGANWAMQCIQNSSTRVSSIDKLKMQFDSLAIELAKLEQDNEGDVEYLASKVVMCRYYMWEFGNKSRSVEVLAYFHDCVTAWKLEGITFSQLIYRQMRRLGFIAEEFEDLKCSQKLEVYNNIMGEERRVRFPEYLTSEEMKRGHNDVVAVAELVVGVTLMELFEDNTKKPPKVFNGLTWYAADVPDGKDIAFNIAYCI